MNNTEKITAVLKYWVAELDDCQLDYTINHSQSTMSAYITIAGKVIRISDHAEKFHALRSDYSVNVTGRSLDDCINDLYYFLEVYGIYTFY